MARRSDKNQHANLAGCLTSLYQSDDSSPEKCSLFLFFAINGQRNAQ
jgi:hypothetical protein